MYSHSKAVMFLLGELKKVTTDPSVHSNCIRLSEEVETEIEAMGPSPADINTERRKKEDADAALLKQEDADQAKKEEEDRKEDQARRDLSPIPAGGLKPAPAQLGVLKANDVHPAKLVPDPPPNPPAAATTKV